MPLSGGGGGGGGGVAVVAAAAGDGSVRIYEAFFSAFFMCLLLAQLG